MFSKYAAGGTLVSGRADTIPAVMALFRRKFRLTACATTGG
jgi:hypothetical protein